MRRTHHGHIGLTRFHETFVCRQTRLNLTIKRLMFGYYFVSIKVDQFRFFIDHQLAFFICVNTLCAVCDFILPNSALMLGIE